MKLSEKTIEGAKRSGEKQLFSALENQMRRRLAGWTVGSEEASQWIEDEYEGEDDSESEKLEAELFGIINSAFHSAQDEARAILSACQDFETRKRILALIRGKVAA